MCANESNNITIVDITEEAMVQAVARIHVEAFAGYLNPRFGMAYITSFISWFVHDKEAVALAAVDAHRRAIGYALGVPTEHGHRPYRDLQGMAVRSLLLRPWLLIDARFWQVAKSRLRVLLKRKRTNHHQDLPNPIMGLVGLGVDSSYRRQGVAVHLLEAFQEKAISRKMQSLSTWVYMDNTSARRLYERCGWKPCRDSLTERGSLRYFKLLDR